MKAIIKIQAVITLLGLSLCVASAGNAVDGVNGKLDFSTGSMDSHWGENLMGSLSLPVSTNLGLQGDGLYSHIGSLNFDGGGLHLFWRDPEKGMLGLSGGGIDGKYLYGLQGGLEGQYYIKQFTLGASLGVTTLQYKNPAPFISTHPIGIFASPLVSYYPLDNVMVQAAYSRIFDNNLGQLLLEYQTPVNGLSCFADLAVGDNGYNHALFGLRFYFGKNKNLIRRHREDDPPNILQQVLYGIGTYGAQFNREGHAYVAEHPGSSQSFDGFDLTSFSLVQVVPGQ